MSIARLILTGCLALLATLASAPALLAAEPTQIPACPWPWWYGHGVSFWWIFPLMFFVFMILMVIFMMRRGGRHWRWHGRMMDGAGSHDAMNRTWGAPSETALDILNKRYAKGEIDKQEYEEKKAVIKGPD